MAPTSLSCTAAGSCPPYSDCGVASGGALERVTPETSRGNPTLSDVFARSQRDEPPPAELGPRADAAMQPAEIRQCLVSAESCGRWRDLGSPPERRSGGRLRCDDTHPGAPNQAKERPGLNVRAVGSFG
jgi:hypothetical protein